MNNRGVMAKKKKTPVAQIEPISLPDEDLAKARAWLEGLNADIAYSQAKRQLAEACGWERSKSNAVIVALHEEGFMAGKELFLQSERACRTRRRARRPRGLELHDHAPERS